MLDTTHRDSPTALNSRGTQDEIAVIIPVYMGRAVLQELCDRLVRTLEQITPSYSIVLVDDRAPDHPWPLIQQLGRENNRIRGVQLSRNFGQHHALTAGIDHARARWYVVMDCDLQDAPEDILMLYAEVQEGFDIVNGLREKEGHSFVKRHSSQVFYRLFNAMAGFQLDWSVGNFRIFSDSVANGYREMREQLRFFPASLNLMGFEVGHVLLPHHPRGSGKSSYTLRKLAGLALNAIIAHSQVPLRIAVGTGLMMAIASLAVALALVVRAMVIGTAVAGWTSLIVSVFLVGGIQVFVTGIVGIYVGKCLDEARKRPLYFVRATSNL